MKNSTLLMVAILGVVVMLSAVIVVVPMQEASAWRDDKDDKDGKDMKDHKDSYDSKDGKDMKDHKDSYDSKDGKDIDFNTKQKQVNKCSDYADCKNHGSITIG